MPKRRRPRSTRKGVNYNQPVHRKRSAQRPSKVAYSQDALEPISTQEATNPDTAREDLSGLASQFAGTLEKYARAFSSLMPPSEGQKVGSAPKTMPMQQSGSLARNATQAVNRELLNHFIEQADRTFQAMVALTTSRSPQDFLRIQTDFVKANLDSVLEAAKRILIVLAQMTTEFIRLAQLARAGARSG
jgi:hypothetical protein